MLSKGRELNGNFTAKTHRTQRKDRLRLTLRLRKTGVMGLNLNALFCAIERIPERRVVHGKVRP
jgi:hypothetical protein